MNKPRIYGMSFAQVYPHYINKAEKEGRTKSEADEIMRRGHDTLGWAIYMFRSLMSSSH